MTQLEQPQSEHARSAVSESSRSGTLDEPIAVVGMACRFPGAATLDAFWQLLAGGGNAVQEGVPGSGVGRMAELFPTADVQNDACRFCAFVDDIDKFDAAFFRISPVEAELLDPQQRIMLETSWQALEDAGIDPERLRGSRTGVYAGISNNEYRSLALEVAESAEPASSLYAVSGTSLNTAIGRVAFALDLAGPAMAVDTACSSALVAIHQAVSGLQRREADLALAGGVNNILSGRLLELRGNAGMLAPDGQCKTFDARANGYVRGEGCGLVVLKRLAEAERDGDRIWAVVRGSAVNQDGASPGLTVPSGDAQARVIQAALARAGMQPQDVDYLEAHGTGTPVGDPIEADAAATAYGPGRPADRPLLIGSVKTNIGHLESAAGVAGFMKAVMALRHGVIPRHLNFETPSPAIDWDRLPLEVTAAERDWPRREGHVPSAGVSGFGWSGTNAHVLLERYEGPTDTAARGQDFAGPAMPVATRDGAQAATRRARLLPLSGKTDAALRESAARYLTWLEGAEPAALADAAWTASVGRSHFDFRAGVVFRDAGSLRERLAALVDPDERQFLATVPRRKLAFAYTGQASQWVGMGRALYETEPVFRAVLDRCDALLREDRGASLLDVMFGREGAPGDLDDPAWKQPSIYALECGLTALWESVGVRPDVVFGHSLGEIAAAQAAGVFSLEDGLRFAAARGAHIGAVPGAGAMAAVFAPADDIAAVVDEHNAASAGIDVSVAVDNGAQQVISGPADAIDTILERFESEGTRVARLRKSPAYHSAMIEPALDGLQASIREIPFAPPSITLLSNVTGAAVAPDAILDTAYWRRHARERVQFRSCVEELGSLGVDAVVELGPHAVLGPMTALAWPGSAGEPPAVVASLMRPRADTPAADTEDAFVAAVGAAYEAGIPVQLEALFAGESRRRVSLPGYPFQRERFWAARRRRRVAVDHPLLGNRHDSARGETAFDTEIHPTDPAWLGDHHVFGRLVAPGALYGAMAASVAAEAGEKSVLIEDFQLQNPLVLGEPDPDDADAADAGRQMQVLVDAPDGAWRRVQVLSKHASEGEWTLHAEARLAASAPAFPAAAEPVDIEALKAGLSPDDVSAYYRAKSALGIDLGASFRSLKGLWSRPGEALAEVALPTGVDAALEIHPLLLDGCFQAVGAARDGGGSGEDETTYLPFAWDRMQLASRLPERLFCHVRMPERPASAGDAEDAPPSGVPEVASGDLRIYDADGRLVGELEGYAVKRATRATLLAAVEGIDELLYEVVWRETGEPAGIVPADFLPAPSQVAADWPSFSEYLGAEGVDARERPSLFGDLSLLARRFALDALDRLGWDRASGQEVEADALRERLGVVPEHSQLFRRTLEILTAAAVLRPSGNEFAVAVASGDPLPPGIPGDPGEFAAELLGRYEHASNEIGLFHRCAGALAGVLRGDEDPLTLLFGSGEPSAGDLYIKAPVGRAANRMLGDAVKALVAELPEDRRLRIIEVGAGTGSATASVLPELPEGRFDYMYTDISAGFFAEAEAQFGAADAGIEYRVLDIENDPVAQGFESHGYDLVIASNVLHATRYLEETLGHCRELLAPSGHLIALENLVGQDWLDLTFGQLDGWWRFADDFRPRYAVAGPEVWRRALLNVGFSQAEVLGLGDADASQAPDRGVIVAQGPAEVSERAGIWIVAGEGPDGRFVKELAGSNQTVVVAGDGDGTGAAGVMPAKVVMDDRDSWRRLVEGLPADLPLHGVVHLAALTGAGVDATTEAMVADVRRIGSSALAMVQGMLDADAAPAKGLWLVTRGAQVLEREWAGQLAGAALWGLGKVAAREAAQLGVRMLDLDPADAAPAPDVVRELMHPDAETHVAYRRGRRMAARLVRAGSERARLTLPEGSRWVVGVGEEALDCLPLAPAALEPDEVRLAVEAAGLNFWDVFATLRLIDDRLLGTEMCGRVIEVGSAVTSVAVGDRVVGVRRGESGTFAPEVVTHEELVARVPEQMSGSALATMPTVFLSAALSYEAAGLKTGDRVLVHAGAGGVGLAAIQLALAADAEVFATASAPKQPYLRDLGVQHVFDSRSTDYGQEILDVTGGAGVDIVLNSLTAEGFIDASLSCLAEGGAFIELAARDILSEEEMRTRRPDVTYAIIKLDALKQDQPALPGGHLRALMARAQAGELTPLAHSRWPLAEAESAVEFMRDGRHLGKIVLTLPPLVDGSLREDRAYLVTGGLGGIGLAVADWLVDRGARTIVLNGRRGPDPEAEAAVAALEARGVDVRVEIADVTDLAAVDAMLARMDETLPPLAGVIHSVGALADGALGNQTWENFEHVLWPKVVGAWHLHRATRDRDLDFFVLFSSVAGVLGNPGQANHAAANAFLDQLAAHRRSVGLPGQAIAWGAWSGLGEAEEQRERIAEHLETRGTGWITPAHGLRAFERLVREDLTAAVVVLADWEAYGAALGARPPLLADLLAATDGESAAEEDLLALLDDAPAGTHGEILASFLQRAVQAVLRLPTPPPPTVGFFDLGMDSLMAVELRNRINRAFGGEYTAASTVVFDYPDIEALAGFLASEIGGSSGASAAPSDAPAAPVAASADDGIAIIGMACRFPGAGDLDAFWQLLLSGDDAVVDARPNADSLGGDGSGTGKLAAGYRRGGFVDALDEFDARFFRVQPIEARGMDPQQRMLLETTWHALEDAAIDPDALRGSRTGVYAGIGTSEYRDLIMRQGASITYLGSAVSMALGRVSFQLGLEGPTMPVSLNCASSLVAIHHAVRGLGQGEVDLALAGGVSTVLSPGVTREMAELGLLSQNGRCSAFDAAADGFVRGEGCGVVVLKRLADAEADGDRIWGVIRGSAVNQNGAAAGPTVPNGPAQERVIETALERAGVAAAEVDYLEAHGAGSQLGDPIEVNAAVAVYGRERDPDRPLAIGSVKTNIGHLESAAGVASLIKTVLAMRHGVIPKHLHFREPNPHVDWDMLPVRVTAEREAWPAHDERPHRAAVSAFGISGVNAHVVLEGHGGIDDVSGLAGAPKAVAAAVSVSEPDREPSQAELLERTTRVLPLSGQSDEALRELAAGYLAWLDAQDDLPAGKLGDLAWTASVGRRQFGNRAAVVFQGVDSLKTALATIASEGAGEDRPAPTRLAFVYSGAGAGWAAAGKALYAVEPVVRAVFDQCDELLTKAGGPSLLDVMLGSSAASAGDPAVVGPGTYALQCATAMLWSGVGVSPSVVVGRGVGGVAAAQAAGVLDIADGLRLAAAPDADAFDALLGETPTSPATSTVVTSGTGGVIEAGGTLDAGYWHALHGRDDIGDGVDVLTGLGVDAVIEISPRSATGDGAPLVLNPAGADSATGDHEDAFVRAVAGVYEAGLDVSLRGLFAGEERRRISLPKYPFQRRRHWIAT